MPAYTLRQFLRSTEGDGSVTDETRDIEAASDGEAIQIAQAVVAEPHQDLVGIELTDIDERLVWSLRRGETISPRPQDV
ncbi:hypothetical protein MKL09_06370 [Methylobacterium sp. J-048]|uniref:hypothetical protein n=1 Tax=Methylobacterium sp. J-048 TaxID=2836635 RepID=UPI001FBA886E|nr:hypothetical protein [Methylobacterium sp. J-048]MCJ2056170.1 hypothetical protein [Methylobacterium sp. J-048]